LPFTHPITTTTTTNSLVHPQHSTVWDDVYGFDMTPIKALAMLEPLVDIVEPKSVVSYHPAPVLELDILTCTKVRCVTGFSVSAVARHT